MEVSMKYLSATTTRTLLARMPLYFGVRLGLAAMVVAPRKARKASNKVKSAPYPTMHNTTVETHEAYELVFFIVGAGSLKALAE